MIIRIWQGSTTQENALPYERLLKEEVFPGIKEKGIKGYRGIQLLKKPQDKEIAFITIMWFDDLDAVKDFAGEDYEQSYVIAKAKKLLHQYDERARHYELLFNSVTKEKRNNTHKKSGKDAEILRGKKFA